MNNTTANIVGCNYQRCLLVCLHEYTKATCRETCCYDCRVCTYLTENTPNTSKGLAPMKDKHEWWTYSWYGIFIWCIAHTTPQNGFVGCIRQKRHVTKLVRGARHEHWNADPYLWVLSSPRRSWVLWRNERTHGAVRMSELHLIYYFITTQEL